MGLESNTTNNPVSTPVDTPKKNPLRDLLMLVAAAGMGVRMSSFLPKAFLNILGRPLIVWTLESLMSSPRVSRIFVAVPKGFADTLRDLLPSTKASWTFSHPPPPIYVLPGDSRRRDSVSTLLNQALKTPIKTSPSESSTQVSAKDTCFESLTAIHDGARPGVTPALIQKVAQAASKHGAAIPVLDSDDTIKACQKDGFIQKTLDRKTLGRAQTPQIFRTALLKRALTIPQDSSPTKDSPQPPQNDEASALEAAGYPVAWVPGDAINLKLTWPSQIPLMEAILRAKTQKTPYLCPPSLDPTLQSHPPPHKAFKPTQRVGIGFDAHRFTPNRPLILGGIPIPHGQGLEAHSDGDVVLHALADALLGACACGDIGLHFPPGRPETKDLSGSHMLASVLEILASKRMRPRQIDLVIMAQKPKIAPHRKVMIHTLAKLLRIETDAVSVKATTTEGMGFTGNGQGIAVQALAVVEPF